MSDDAESRTTDLGSVTLPLRWENFDDGIPHHRLWTLMAGPFEIGEVFFSAAHWGWQFVGRGDDEHVRSGHPTLEAAQAELIRAVKASVQE